MHTDSNTINMRNDTHTLYFICILCSATSLSITSLFFSSLWLCSYINTISMNSKAYKMGEITHGTTWKSHLDQSFQQALGLVKVAPNLFMERALSKFSGNICFIRNIPIWMERKKFKPPIFLDRQLIWTFHNYTTI